MRTWLCAVVVLVGCGEGAGGDGAGAPACDIPAVGCADGAEPVRTVHEPTGTVTLACADGERWQDTVDGRRIYFARAECGRADVVECWAADGTVALARVYEACEDFPAESCWAEDGEPESCESVSMRFSG